MSEAPWLIPYVDHHDGPRRVLTLHLTSGNLMAEKHAPVTAIDGRRYVVPWGPVHFEVPADRNVHVSVHVEADHLTQFASTLLGPGDGPVGLRYETRWGSGVGSLGPLA